MRPGPESLDRMERFFDVSITHPSTMSTAPKAAAPAAQGQAAPEQGQGDNKLYTILRALAMFAVVQIGKLAARPLHRLC